MGSRARVSAALAPTRSASYPVFEKLLGRPPISLKDFLAEALKP